MRSVAIPSITDLEELICNIFLAGRITSMQYLWLLNTAQAMELSAADQALIDRVLYGIRHGLLQIVEPDHSPTFSNQG